MGHTGMECEDSWLIRHHNPIQYTNMSQKEFYDFIENEDANLVINSNLFWTFQIDIGM